MEKFNKLMEPYRISRVGIDEAVAGVREFINEREDNPFVNLTESDSQAEPKTQGDGASV
jgi:hypothetical protein